MSPYLVIPPIGSKLYNICLAHIIGLVWTSHVRSQAPEASNIASFYWYAHSVIITNARYCPGQYHTSFMISFMSMLQQLRSQLTSHHFAHRSRAQEALDGEGRE